MKNGAGTPYLVITDYDGNIVSEKVIKFNYVFAEDPDDLTTIIFQYMDPTFPDNKGMQERRFLTCKWGYRETPDKFQLRKVYIRECIPDYNETGMTLELKCSDKASMIKNNKPRKTHTGNPREITQAIADENGLNYKEELMIDQGDNTPANLDNVQLEGYPQAGVNDKRFLEEMWNEQEGGLYSVEGRDDDLIVRKRNYNQKPKKTFVYGKDPRELLKFRPETKNRFWEKKAKKNRWLYYDPITRTERIIAIDALADKTTRLGEVDEYSKDYFVNAVVEHNKWKELEEKFKDMPTHPDDAADPVDPRDIGWKNGPNYLAQRENTATLGKVFVNEGLKRRNELWLRGWLDSHAQGEWAEQQAYNQALAERQRAANETNPGSATILGDTGIESSIVLTFQGLAKKYTGNYYIIKANHSLVPDQGYLVELDFVRNGRGRTGAEGPGKTSLKDQVKINKVTGGYEVVIGKKKVIVSEDDIKQFGTKKMKSDTDYIKDIEKSTYDRYNNPYPDEAP